MERTQNERLWIAGIWMQKSSTAFGVELGARPGRKEKHDE